MDVERTNYALRGKVGDDGKLGDLQLGQEVLLVVAATVSKRSDHYDDGVVVCDAQLSVVGAALIGANASWRKSALTALSRAAHDDGKLL
jgi:hypothetical protein